MIAVLRILIEIFIGLVICILLAVGFYIVLGFLGKGWDWLTKEGTRREKIVFALFMVLLVALMAFGSQAFGHNVLEAIYGN